MTPKEQALLQPFSKPGMYTHNRMRRAIGFLRFHSDYAEAGILGCENCPPWMERKVYVILTATM